MKMFVLLALFALVGMGFAQEATSEVVSDEVSDEELIGEEAGTTPDNFFYMFKRFGEGVNLFFTFDNAEKARLHYKFAKTRLAESVKLQNDGKTELADQTLEEYNTELEATDDSIESAQASGSDVTVIVDEVSEQNYQHALVLQKMYEKLKSEKAKAITEKTLESSMKKRADIASRLQSASLVEMTVTVGDKSVTLNVPEKFAEKFFKKSDELKQKVKHKVKAEIKSKSKKLDMLTEEPCPEEGRKVVKKVMKKVESKKKIKEEAQEKKEKKKESESKGKGKGKDKGSQEIVEQETNDEVEDETEETVEEEVVEEVVEYEPCPVVSAMETLENETNGNQTGNETSGNETNTCPPPKIGDQNKGKKTTICHLPPGNPSNMHTIIVGNAAVPAHLRHGDFLGACDCQEDNETDDNETDMNDTNETLADLTVDSIVIEPSAIAENGSVDITVNILNLGSLDAENYMVNIFDITANMTVAEELVALTASGNSSIVMVEYANVLGLGNHTIVAFADSTAIIEESDETNNVDEGSFEVQSDT